MSFVVGERPQVTREFYRVAYWLGGLLALALVVLSAVAFPDRVASVASFRELVWTAAALALLLAVANGALGGGLAASVAVPVAVSLGVEAAAIHFSLAGTDIDQTLAGATFLFGAVVVGAAVAGGVCWVVGLALRRGARLAGFRGL